MKDILYLIIGLVIVIGSVFIFFTRSPTKDNQVKIIQINGASIDVELVDTPQTREKGLSNRKTLENSKGMLFIFDNASQYGFWMKDMNFAIDIVWIDENLHIIDIDKEVSPETFPKIFYPEKEVKYVLEIPAGASDKYHFEIGAVIQL